jgi:hypothetical protein
LRIQKNAFYRTSKKLLVNFEQSLFTTNEINFVAVEHEVSRSLTPKIVVGDGEVEVSSIF